MTTLSVQCDLSFQGDDLNFDEITELVGVSPTGVHRAGPQRRPLIIPRLVGISSRGVGLSGDGVDV